MTIAEEDTDDLGYMGRTCFVIMPFGEKLDTAALQAKAASAPAGPSPTLTLLPGAQVSVIDFDRVYKALISPAVAAAAKKVELEIACIRSDQVGHSGFIHREMMEHVTGADIAIVDITTQNANVFYELGVRHSFRRATTILIQRIGTYIPFNIAGMRVFPYSDDDTADEHGRSPLETSCEKLRDIIVSSITQKENDSLVHHLLPDTSVIRESWPIMERKTVWFDVLDRDKKRIVFTGRNGRPLNRSVGFITGDLLHINDVDAWVNPENTKMQMARFHDGSVSSNIRYYGALRNEGGHVVDDTIANALLKSMQGNSGVEPGVVLSTSPGHLRQTNNVKLILHVAALQGEPGKGYQPIRDYPGCVRRVLSEIDRLNAMTPASTGKGRWGIGRKEAPEGSELHGLACTSVLFPLFGTRSSGQHPQTVAENLYRAAVVFLEQHHESEIDAVYFLAYTTQDRELCERAMGLLQSKDRITPSLRTRAGEASKDDPGTAEM